MSHISSHQIWFSPIVSNPISRDGRGNHKGLPLHLIQCLLLTLGPVGSAHTTIFYT